MASKRDLIEAHKYNRRRLVSAFVSGTPGGKEVESISRARPVVAGGVLAALMVAGVAASGFLAPGLPDDWDQQGVVVTEDGGERFLALDGTLYPVINTTSARLQLPAESGYRVEVVPDDAVASAPRGATIGILGAPDDLPTKDQLEQSGWNACLGEDGTTYLTIDGNRTLGADPTSGVMLAGETGAQLVTGGVRYPVPADLEADVLRTLGLDTAPPLQAPGSFTDLFTPGSELDFPLERIAGLGERLPAAFGTPGGATTVGQLIRNTDVRDAPSILTRAGTAALSEFAAALYSVQVPAGLGTAVDVTNADLAGIPNDTARYVPEDWPTRLPSTTTDQPCAVLHTSADERAATALATVPADHEIFTRPPVRVAPGRGALVRASSTGTSSGPVYLVDQTATRFEITDPSAETLARLGYAGVDPALVPAPWLVPLGDGPELNAEAARRAVSGALDGPPAQE